ncbi:MAG: DUF2092 domain-containing protein [Rhodospirillaceae bacterium]|nr:MAG: DUF2092 domain-containing protein [Rhodospirillaceae bacterium]
MGMCDYLASQDKFTMSIRAGYDVVQESGQKIEFRQVANDRNQNNGLICRKTARVCWKYGIDEKRPPFMAKSTIQQTRNQGYEPRKLGAEVRRLRDEKRLSQDQLAKTHPFRSKAYQN